MPETISVRPVCAPCGRIPAHLKNYQFSAVKRETLPLKYGFVELAKTDRRLGSAIGAENAPWPDMETIRRIALLGEPSPVMIPTSQLPKQTIETLSIIGDRFAEEMRAVCKWVCFTPHLENEGVWLDGFVLGERDEKLDALSREFFAEAPTQFPLDKIMFVNLYDDAGRPRGDQELHFTMRRLLEEMKANQPENIPTPQSVV